MRSATSAGGVPTSRSKVQPRYSHGSGNSSGDMNISESLPSCSSIQCMASSEPSASPSGFSCVVSSSFSEPRSSAITSSCPVAMLISSSSSSVIRIPRSIDSSNTNWSVGVRFIRSSRPIACWSSP